MTRGERAEKRPVRNTKNYGTRGLMAFVWQLCFALL